MQSHRTIRVIKKYPNRRLYDTAISNYITLADVKQLVLTQNDFCVQDAKTHQDLTRSILLQIILDEEAGGSPVFTDAVLLQIIRFYGNNMQRWVGAYLEKNVLALADLQQQLVVQSLNHSPEHWASLMASPPPVVQQISKNYTQQLQAQTAQMLALLGMSS